jgi:hypothetical protein
MDSKHLKAACLGAALATAWGAADETQAATDVTIGFNLNASMGPHSISHAMLAYTLNPSGSDTFGPFTIETGSPVQFSSGLNPTDYNKYVLVGLGTPGHVVVSMSSGVFGQPFETVFPGFDEPTIASYLAADDPAINTFTSSVLGGSYATDFNNGSDAVLFSDGGLLGSIGVDAAEPIPEPTGLVIGGVIFGGTGLLSRRRR